MNESCLKLLLGDAFRDTTVTESEIDNTFENQNYDFLATINEISKKVPYYLENEKETHVHRKNFNFIPFALSREESHENAKRKSEEDLVWKVDFHHISRYASNQLITRLFCDLNPEMNYDLTLIVGKGKHSQSQTSLTKDIVGKIVKTSKYGPGFIPDSNDGTIKYKLKSDQTKTETYDPKSKTIKTVTNNSLVPLEFDEHFGHYYK